MTLTQGLITAAIVALGLVSFLHSYFGEKLLLAPMFKRRGNAVLENELARKVLRGAWHLTSFLWVIMAIILYSLSFNFGILADTILLTFGVGFLMAGLYSLLLSRGRHIGWPVLSAIGILSFAAYATGGANL